MAKKIVKRAISPAKEIVSGTVRLTAPVDSYNATYLAPNELMDSPDYWQSENSYFGQTPAQSAEKPWYQTLIDIYGAVRGQREAEKFRKEQLERQRAGLPSLTVEDWRRITPPAATVEFGMTPMTRNLLIAGAVALGAMFLSKGRRRA